MNLVKTLAMAAVLGTIVCATYVMLNHKPDANPLPDVAFDLNANMKWGQNDASGNTNGPMAPPSLPGGSSPLVNPVQPAAATEATKDHYSTPGPYLAPITPDLPPSGVPSIPPPPTIPAGAMPDPGPAPYGNPPFQANPNLGANPNPGANPNLGANLNPGANPQLPPNPNRASNPDPMAPPAPPSFGGPGMPAPPDANLRVLDSPPSPVAQPAQDHDSFMQAVRQQLHANRLAEAHAMLSQRYRQVAMTPVQTTEIISLLDQLAGTVIYSQKFGPFHEVKSTDTLDSIALQNNVPTGLLVKINGLNPQMSLRPGQRLKVVQGPFEGVVNLDRQELTLYLRGELYAGRFRLALGPDSNGQEGSFAVANKTDLTVATSGPHPVYGTRWIGLSDTLGLHGTSLPMEPGRPVSQGCIVLAQRDIEDLFDILSIHSKVVVRR
ncbi:MAG: LysM peptidoglycan-binding domain-containing protein [Pirellulales bacterium]|nr:LysM peptidoglycan-binding domain-containing protein [Pirellulales bacterium]